jgi:sec-independent protein translocase protein TatA
MGEFGPLHWLIVIIAAAVLFGAKRLPDAARSLGRSARILKAELSGLGSEAPPSVSSEPSVSSADARPVNNPTGETHRGPA